MKAFSAYLSPLLKRLIVLTDARTIPPLNISRWLPVEEVRHKPCSAAWTKKRHSINSRASNRQVGCQSFKLRTLLPRFASMRLPRVLLLGGQAKRCQ